MRFAPVLFLFAAGCLPLDSDGGAFWDSPDGKVSDGGMLMTTANLGYQFESVGISDDGAKVHADMGMGTWCGFRSSDGYMESDTTLDQDVAVQDMRDDMALVSHPGEGGMSLVLGADTEYDYWAPEGNLVSARLRDEGVVAYTDDGLLHWYNGGEESVMDVGNCRELTLDTGSDTAWLACDSGVIRSRAHTTTPVPSLQAARAVAWSDTAQELLALSQDHTGLRAYDADGAPLWSTTLDAPAMALEAVGDLPYFLALVDDGGTSAVALLTDDGELIDQLPVGGGNVQAAHASSQFVVYGDYTSAVYQVLE